MTANMGQLQQAEQYYLRAADLVPNSARLHEQIAGFYLDVGQPQAAFTHIDKAVELVEDSDWAYYSYYLAGIAHTMMGNTEGARLAFITTIAKSNSSSVCYPALIRLVEIMPEYEGETCI